MDRRKFQDARAVDVLSAQHYQWGAGCDGWRLLNLPNLSVIQERAPPGAAEIRHFHQRAQQFFYVLSGAATLECGESRVELQAGQGCHVAAGLEHRFSNLTDRDVIFLVISSESTLHDRINV